MARLIFIDCHFEAKREIAGVLELLETFNLSASTLPDEKA
jgi:hypothetical protein